MLNAFHVALGEVQAMDEAEGAIYAPPKAGLPFLVVTFGEGGNMSAQPTATRSEARMLLTRERSKRTKVTERLREITETPAAKQA